MIMNGNVAHVDLRRPERRFLRGDDQIAGERDPERAREHVPVGGAHRRLSQRGDQPEQRDEALRAEVLVHERRVPREPAEVGARGEDLLVRGREHHAAHRVVVAGALKRLRQAQQQLRGERVARVRVVQRDRRDASVVERVDDRVGWHSGILTSSPSRVGSKQLYCLLSRTAAPMLRASHPNLHSS